MLIQSVSGNSSNAEVKLGSYLNSTIIWINCPDHLFAEMFVILAKYFMPLPTTPSNSSINRRDNGVYTLPEHLAALISVVTFFFSIQIGFQLVLD